MGKLEKECEDVWEAKREKNETRRRQSTKQTTTHRELLVILFLQNGMQLEEWLEQGHCTVDVACRHRQRRLREGLQHLAHTGEAVPVPHITGLVDVLREGLVHVHDEVLHDGGEEGVPCG